MGHAIIKRLVGLVIALSVTASALPLYFVDQYFRTIEELDEALRNGEITPEDYDEMRDWFLEAHQMLPDMLPRFSYRAPERYPEWGRLSYSGKYRFNVDDNAELIRDDAFALTGNSILPRIRAELSLQRTTGGIERVASRKLVIAFPDFPIIQIGNVLGSGMPSRLSTGGFAIRSALNRQSNFANSILFPTRARSNGIEIMHSFNGLRVATQLSHQEGVAHGFSSLSLRTDKGQERVRWGFVVSHHRLAKFGGAEKRLTFVAPMLKLDHNAFGFLGESCVGISAAAAHQYSVTLKRAGGKLQVLAFDYGKEFWNLDSDGYAYSDYSGVRFDEIDFEYSEKRAGRRGVLIESEVGTRKRKLVGEIVRWRNRLEERDAAAARVTAAYRPDNRVLRELRLQTIWEDFDLKRELRSRRQVTVNSEWQFGAHWRVESLHRLAQHHREATERKEWRWMQSVRCQVNKEMNLEVAADWRDSDWQRGGNERLLLTLAQEVDAGHNAQFRFLAQTRYYPERDKLTDWEVRVETRLVN